MRMIRKTSRILEGTKIFDSIYKCVQINAEAPWMLLKSNNCEGSNQQLHWKFEFDRFFVLVSIRTVTQCNITSKFFHGSGQTNAGPEISTDDWTISDINATAPDIKSSYIWQLCSPCVCYHLNNLISLEVFFLFKKSVFCLTLWYIL